MRSCFSALQRAEIAEIEPAFDEHRLPRRCFSALQRAEIAEICQPLGFAGSFGGCFSALQRAEIAEMCRRSLKSVFAPCFSALQRAEIAEIQTASAPETRRLRVSVLFNEPKLLKSIFDQFQSASPRLFQCSSTSRNC